MRCSRAVRDIRALGGGGEPSPELASHLAGCPACAAVFAEHQATLAGIKAMRWPLPSPALVARLGRPGSLEPSPTDDRRVRARTAPGVARSGRVPSPPGASTARRLRPADALAAALMLAVAGWVLVQSRSAVPVATLPASATAVATAGEAPHAAPTRVGDGGRLIEFRGVAGRPIELSLQGAWDQAADRGCRRVWLELGDGASLELACPEGPPPDAYPGMPSDSAFAIAHAYAAGTYFPQLRMALEDGTELVQTAAQVVVAPAPPRSLAAEVLRLKPFPWALGITVLGLLWLAVRRARDRWLGLGVAVAVGVLFAAAFVAPLTRALTPMQSVRGTQGHASGSILSYLHALRGQVGLDPLDPRSPLADYAVETVERGGRHLYFVTRFTYADGTSRRYRVPIEAGSSPTRRDGLGRLRTEHRELSGIPFADLERDGIALDVPIPLGATAGTDPESDAARSWLGSGCAATRGNLAVAPDGSAFLAAQRMRDGRTAVRHVPVLGGPDRLITVGDSDVQWSPSGQHLVVVRPDPGGFRVSILSPGTGHERSIAMTVAAQASPGTTTDGVWIPQPDGVWLVPWSGGAWQRRAEWPIDRTFAPIAHARAAGGGAVDGDPLAPASALVRPSPDGTRMAYSCHGGLCIMATDADERAVVDVRVDDVAWSPDGQQLAAVERMPTSTSWDGRSRTTRTIWLIDREGTTRSVVAVSPEGPVSAPAWTRDGRRLFLTACPYDGRRIITVDAATGQARDLSQPRWDAWAALMPSENALLLGNGRGGYWRAEILER